MKLKQVLTIAFLLVAGVTQGQSLSEKHQTVIPRLYHQNYFYLNPAFAGSEGQRELGVSTHLNSLGSSKTSSAPLSVIAYYHGAVGDTTRNGVGVVAMYDQFGPYWLGKLGLSYTKRFKLAEQSYIGVGAELSGKYMNVDLAEFSRGFEKRMVGHDNDLRPDVNAGVWLNVKDFYAGATFANLLEPTFNLSGATELHDERELYLTAGYKFKVTEDISVTPSIFLDKPLKDGKMGTQFTALTNVKFLSLGATYRNGGRFEFEQAPLSILAGVNLSDRFAFMTSYDLTQEKNSIKPDPQVEASLRMRF